MFREGSEPDIYRDSLAEEIKNAPEEEQEGILEQAKRTPEYQIARNKKIEGRQEEEEIDDGLGVFVKKKTLYHGSATTGVKKTGFKISEDDNSTVGRGIYCTSSAADAVGYAKGRVGMGRGGLSGKDEVPVIYECSVENMKFLDLRKSENIKRVMPGWIKILEDELSNPNYKYWYKQPLKEAIERLRAEKIGGSNLQEGVHINDKLFSEYVASLGYEGLVTIEGGEINNPGDHDSYVIFDPEKVKIIKEQKIKKEEKAK